MKRSEMITRLTNIMFVAPPMYIGDTAELILAAVERLGMLPPDSKWEPELVDVAAKETEDDDDKYCGAV